MKPHDTESISSRNQPTPRRRGRPRTGSIEPHGDHWDIRPTLADGGRGVRVCLPPGVSEAMAREKAAALTELAARKGTTREPAPPRAEPIAPKGPLLASWSDAWCEDRERRGLSSVDADRGRLRKWILPRLSPPLGERHADSITTVDLERLVEDPDTRVQAGELSWKTAKNVWGVVSKMFDDMARSKTAALRVRSDNPASGVRPPDEGVKRSKGYLYPSEFLAVVSCERVPLRWRRLIAAQVYTYTRAGELEALGDEDVDLTHLVIHVHRAIDRSEGTEKETKTNQPRRFAAEPELVPLLERLSMEARAEGR